MTKRVYFIELDLDDEDLRDILKEFDKNAKIRYTRFKSFDEYDDFRHYDDMLGGF